MADFLFLFTCQPCQEANWQLLALLWAGLLRAWGGRMEGLHFFLSLGGWKGKLGRTLVNFIQEEEKAGQEKWAAFPSFWAEPVKRKRNAQHFAIPPIYSLKTKSKLKNAIQHFTRLLCQQLATQYKQPLKNESRNEGHACHRVEAFVQ